LFLIFHNFPSFLLFCHSFSPVFISKCTSLGHVTLLKSSFYDLFSFVCSLASCQRFTSCTALFELVAAKCGMKPHQDICLKVHSPQINSLHVWFILSILFNSLRIFGTDGLHYPVLGEKIFCANITLDLHSCYLVKLYCIAEQFETRNLFCLRETSFNPLKPNDPYRPRTAPLTSKVAFYIFIQQI